MIPLRLSLGSVDPLSRSVNPGFEVHASVSTMPKNLSHHFQRTVRVIRTAASATGRALAIAILLVCMLPIMILLAVAAAAFDSEDSRELRQ
jgi:hypothetical protein